MALVKKESTTLITRFREFDEARVYIEDMRKDKELTFDAIDYMIEHKEYYFLLNNLLKNFQNSEEKDIVEYIFARLDVCLSREEDKDILRRLLCSTNSHIKKETFTYIVECAKKSMLEVLDENEIDFRFFLKFSPTKETEEFLKKAFDKRVKEIADIMDYFRLYLDERELLEILKELENRYDN